MLKRVILLYVEAKNYKSGSESFSHTVYKNMYTHVNDIPDYLRFGLKITSILYFILFFLFTTKKFKKKSFKKVKKWNLPILKDFIRFLDSIYEIAKSEINAKKLSKEENLLNKFCDYDFIIVGSGPGGAVSAKELKKHGFNTLIIEQGGKDENNLIKPYSYSEMREKYINAGVNTTFGNCKYHLLFIIISMFFFEIAIIVPCGLTPVALGKILPSAIYKLLWLCTWPFESTTHLSLFSPDGQDEKT